MKTLLIALVTLIPFCAFAEYDLQSLILKDSRVKKIILHYKNAGYTCEEKFSEFFPISKSSILDAKVALEKCKKNIKCEGVQLSDYVTIPKSRINQELKIVKEELANFPVGFETIITGQMECAPGIGQKGIAVTVGEYESDNNSAKVLEVQKY